MYRACLTFLLGLVFLFHSTTATVVFQAQLVLSDSTTVYAGLPTVRLNPYHGRRNWNNQLGVELTVSISVGSGVNERLVIDSWNYNSTVYPLYSGEVLCMAYFFLPHRSSCWQVNDADKFQPLIITVTLLEWFPYGYTTTWDYVIQWYNTDPGVYVFQAFHFDGTPYAGILPGVSYFPLLLLPVLRRRSHLFFFSLH